MKNEIKKAVEKIRRYYEERKKNGKGLLCGSPYSLKINGDISAGHESSSKPSGLSRLAAFTETNINAEFSVYDFLDDETEEPLLESVDMSLISGFEITGQRGDMVQATIKTYNGDVISCPVTSLRVTFDGIRASEFVLPKYFNDINDINDIKDIKDKKEDK